MKNVVVVPAYNESDQIMQTLNSLYMQTLRPEGVVVVDNGSTDATAGIVARAACSYPNLYLIDEPRKGTGFAVNTGCNYAIDELGAEIISRTDADTVVSPDWTSNIKKSFQTTRKLQLLSGPSYPKKDRYHRKYDQIAWPLLRKVFLLGMAAVSRDLAMSRIAIGHNLSTRASAFLEVGGFRDGDIGESDEDIEYSKAVRDRFGLTSIQHHPEIKVYTSMRRVRKLGYIGMSKYYLYSGGVPSKERRHAMLNGEIDIR
jgi:glycosyltransferase involved in cell wall biosynthesis